MTVLHNIVMCQICWESFKIEGELQRFEMPVCPDCRNLEAEDKLLLQYVSQHIVKLWFLWYSKKFVDGPLKSRMEAIAAKHPNQMGLDDDKSKGESIA